MIKRSENYKIKYKKNGDDYIAISGKYSEKEYWTILLDDIASFREFGDLINAVRHDILNDSLEVKHRNKTE